MGNTPNVTGTVVCTPIRIFALVHVMGLSPMFLTKNCKVFAITCLSSTARLGSTCKDRALMTLIVSDSMHVIANTVPSYVKPQENGLRACTQYQVALRKKTKQFYPVLQNRHIRQYGTVMTYRNSIVKSRKSIVQKRS